MHIYFNIREAAPLNKKNMHAYVINLHRITLNMHKMVLLQLVPHRKKDTSSMLYVKTCKTQTRN